MSKEFLSELSFKFELTDDEKEIVEYLLDIVMTREKCESSKDVVPTMNAWLLNRKMWLDGMKLNDKDPSSLFAKMRTQPKLVSQILERHFGAG